MNDRTWTLESVSEMARGFRLPLIFLTLVRTGVIEALTVGPARGDDLASRCGLDAKALIRLLNVLVSTGLIHHSEGAYRLDEDLARDLVPGDIGSPFDGLSHTAEGMDKWFLLGDVLERGHAQYPDEMDVTTDPDRNERFIRAMHSYAGPAAHRFAEIVGGDAVSSFLDIGGGPGTFALAMLARYPDLKATVADLPLTLRVTRQVIEEAGVGDRMSTIEANFYDDPGCNLAGPWDLVLISAVMHAEGDAQNRALLGRVRPVVAKTGRIVIRENILAEDRTGPPRATMFDVHMLVSTRRGKCYSLDEISAMLADAGFANPRLLSTAEDGYVVADG